MPRNVYDKNTPTSFANLSPEKLREVVNKASEARHVLLQKKKLFKEYAQIIGQQTITLEDCGVEVPREIAMMYVLYNKAIKGDLNAMKLILSLHGELDSVSITEINNQIIKLKVE